MSLLTSSVIGIMGVHIELVCNTSICVTYKCYLVLSTLVIIDNFHFAMYVDKLVLNMEN